MTVLSIRRIRMADTSLTAAGQPFLAFREVSMQHDWIYDVTGGTADHTLLFGLAASQYDDDEISGDRVHTPPNPALLRIDIYDPAASYGLVIPETFSRFRNQQRDDFNYGVYIHDLIDINERNRREPDQPLAPAARPRRSASGSSSG